MIRGDIGITHVTPVDDGLRIARLVSGGPSLATARGGEAQQRLYETENHLITLWDVLEHVTNPQETLQQCKKLLSPKGILLVNYPDAGTWQAKIAGKSFWWFRFLNWFSFIRNMTNTIRWCS